MSELFTIVLAFSSFSTHHFCDILKLSGFYLTIHNIAIFNRFLVYTTIIKYEQQLYCDVVAQNWNSGARARRPLLSNDPEIMFLLKQHQQMGHYQVTSC